MYQPSDATQGRTVRVVLADDHAILRQALGSLLRAQPEIDLVGEASNGVEAVEVTVRHVPDIVLMDLAMPELNGIEATRQIHHQVPSVRVIILSSYGDHDRLRDALRAGATGYIVKRSNMDELMLAIRVVNRGNTYFSNDLSESMDVGNVIFEARQSEAGTAAELLSDRERTVLQLLAEGHTSKEVAQKLSISPKTVEGHKVRIMAKTHTHNRTELLRLAIREGIVRFDEGETTDADTHAEHSVG